jgi:MSHA biogenesis protein MshN
MSPKAADGKTYTARQSSANLLGEAVMLDRQGHQEEAKVLLQRALAANPLDVQARQMLSQLQLETGQVEKAGALLAEGQRLFPEQSNFTLMLARLKTDAGDISGAIQLLEAGRGSARNEPEYQAFLAALLLRAQRLARLGR